MCTLLLQSSNGPVYSVIGMALPGNGCGNINFPSLFLRLSAYSDWIASVAGVPINTPSFLWRSRANQRVVNMNIAGQTLVTLPGSVDNKEVVMQIDPLLNPGMQRGFRPTAPLHRCTSHQP